MEMAKVKSILELLNQDAKNSARQNYLDGLEKNRLEQDGIRCKVCFAKIFRCLGIGAIGIIKSPKLATSKFLNQHTPPQASGKPPAQINN